MLISIVFSIFAHLSSAATLSRCGTDHPSDDLRGFHLTWSEQEALASYGDSEQKIASSVNISTYVHIISSADTELSGNISLSKVTDQINILNAAYSGAGFTFVVQAVGRTVNAKWRNIVYQGSAEYTMKMSLRQGTYKDLNIYFTTIAPDLGGNQALGYATFPATPVSSLIFNRDGLVIDPNTVPGGTLAPYNLGKTAVHEIGHWLGLFHPFQPPYYPAPVQGGCIGQGDMVWDTPAEKSAAFGCQVGRDTCSGNATSIDGTDAVHNYMDYSDDACLNTFTPGQYTRMQSVFDSLRLRSNF